ncbi:MAG: hypothetical protein NTV01_08100 [Bacteroidia bacterium]|nr:hypothetical protein [Bacteroidia bacterium]
MLQLFSFGNLKQDGGTAIFNFCSSANCPSEKLGLCKLPSKCYAKKAERIFPGVTKHRNHQAAFWQMCTPELFIYELRKFQFNKLRLSESGDFISQADISKSSRIAELLDVPVWTYTARRDLDFSNLPTNFTVTGSGFMLDNLFNVVPDPTGLPGVICKANCRICSFCTEKAHRIINCKIH